MGFYLMADGGSNVEFWSEKLANLPTTTTTTTTTAGGAGGGDDGIGGGGRKKFLVHLGSATRDVDGCDRSAYLRTRESMSSSSVPVYATPGDNDYPNCDDPSKGWEMYREHVSNVDEEFWEEPTEYDVRRQGSRDENFSFLYGRVLFVGLNMVSNVADGE